MHNYIDNNYNSFLFYLTTLPPILTTMNTQEFLKNSFKGHVGVKEVVKKLSESPYCLKGRWNNKQIYSLCYNKHKSDFSNPIVKESNGLVLEQDTNEIICYGIDYFDELELDSITKGSIKFQRIPDGSIMKLFYYQNQWCVSSTKMPDAKDTFWRDNNSFYDLFMEVINTKYPKLLDSLEQKYTYTWIMHHPKARVVNPSQSYEIYLVSVTEMTTFKEYLPSWIKENLTIKEEIKYVEDQDSTTEELLKVFAQLEYYEPGLWTFEEVQNRIVRHKLKNPDFERIITKYRSNTYPALPYKYLELINNNPDDIETTLKYYPEYRTTFEETKHKIEQVIISIHYYYLEKFIRYNKPRIPRAYLPVIYEMKNKYLADRQKTTQQSIHTYISTLPVKIQASIYQIHNQVRPTFTQQRKKLYRNNKRQVSSEKIIKSANNINKDVNFKSNNKFSVLVEE